ncbi:MAG: aminodeoxychorismate synthase component I [Alphaproteobacteria bacterium]|nr:aminodeoxychorismate synthase component I [Alphaproteobacteria bacterium]
MLTAENEPFALFDDATYGDRGALLFEGAEELIEAHGIEDFAAALTAIDAAAARGRAAAGVCSYELGYAFEPRLRPLMPRTGRPLLRFHLFGKRRRLSAGERAAWLASRSRGAPLAGEVRPALDEAAHAAKVARVRHLIGAGDVYQVNFTFKLKTAGAGDAFATYAALRETSRAGACAFLRFADEDILSFSPELFFRVTGTQIAARPMKGTVARAPDIAGDALRRQALVADEKQRAENLMIVDLLRNDLARVSRPGSVQVSDLFTVETYPRFHTLTSGIDAELAGPPSLARVLPALFPCGSVTGAPKIRAMEVIREIEDEPRGVYCGAVGFVTRRRMAFNVAIRTLVMRPDAAEMGVGGGIVWDSEPSAEYAECLVKARFFTERAVPFRLIETLRWTAGDGFHLLAHHLARLKGSCVYFGFPFDDAAVARSLAGAVAGGDGVLRVRLTLGPNGDVEVTTEPFALPGPDAVWRYAFAREPVVSGDWRLYHKTTDRGFYDEALAVEKAVTGCDEVVFVNERGEVTEGSRTNLFLERDGVWLTPPLSCGLLDGCLRRELILSGRAAERMLRPRDLASGRVWFGNALRGMIAGAAADRMPLGRSGAFGA